MKKILLLLSAWTAGFSAFAATEVQFTNKVFADDTVLHHYEYKYIDNDGDRHSDSETAHDFPALKERMQAEIKTDRVDAMVKATVALDDYNYRDFGFKGVLNDWYVEFRPIPSILLGMHDEINTTGSYLPIYDGNMANGNIGSHGFTFVYVPAAVEGKLRLGATVPFSFSDEDDEYYAINWLYNDSAEKEHLNAGIGAIFTQEYFEIGGSIKDILEDDYRSFGAYIYLPGLFGNVPRLTLGAGFNHGSKAGVGIGDLISFKGNIYDSADGETEWNLEDEGCTITSGFWGMTHGVWGKNLLNAAATYKADAFTLVLEMVSNFFEDGKANKVSKYDLYSGVAVSFTLADKLTATATGKLLHDFSDDSDDYGDTAEDFFFGAFNLDYEINKQNTVGVGIETGICDKDWSIALPAYWKYTFSK